MVAADDLTVLHANPACADFLSIAPQEAQGRPIAEALPSDAESLLDLFRAARDSSTPVCINQFRFAGGPDPDRVWTVTLTPKRASASGDVTELVLFLTDATERVRLVRAADRAAEAERRRAEQLDATFASMADAVILVDDAGRVKKCNGAAAAMFDLGEATNLSIDAPKLALERISGGRLEPNESPLARALRGETVRREEAVVARSRGPSRLVSVSAAPVEAEEVVTGAVAVFHDISDIRDAEGRVKRALRAEKRRAREAQTLYDAVRAVSSDLDLRERLKAVAETMAAAVGVSRCCIWLLEETTVKGAVGFGLGDEAAEELRCTALKVEELSAAAKEAIETRSVTCIAEAAAMPEKGRLRCGRGLKSALVVPLAYGDRVTGIAYLDEPGARQRFTHADRALAAAISSQAAVAIENARLYQLEQERARMLEFMMAELSHRVKNSLAIVCGLLTLQLSEFDSNAGAQRMLRDCIARIQSISLIHQVLHEENLDAVDLKETARQIVAMVRDTFAAPGQEISSQVRGDRLMVPCNLATSLGLAINELACNALRHGFAGRERGRIVVAITAGDPIRITVSDNGGSLPGDFDPVGDGHVGFLVVRGLVETELGGSFILRDRRGGGVTAILTFPAAALAAA